MKKKHPFFFPFFFSKILRDRTIERARLSGVKEANVFLPIKIQYNEDVTMKSIEKQIIMMERR